MHYHFSKTLPVSINEAVALVKESLTKNGFGVVTEIDMTTTLKNKIGSEIYPYIILGACSPKHAYTAIQAEAHIGLMLPCNVIIREFEPGKCEVSAIDPVASMQAVENESLGPVATEVRAGMKAVIEGL